MSKRPDSSYFPEGNPENFKKQCTISLFFNTSQEQMIGPVVDDGPTFGSAPSGIYIVRHL